MLKSADLALLQRKLQKIKNYCHDLSFVRTTGFETVARVKYLSAILHTCLAQPTRGMEDEMSGLSKP